MSRHMVTLTTTITIDFPEDMELNPELPEVQSYLKEEFKDYLDAATPYITWSFDIDPDVEDDVEEEPKCRYCGSHDLFLNMDKTFLYCADCASKQE